MHHSDKPFCNDYLLIPTDGGGPTVAYTKVNRRIRNHIGSQACVTSFGQQLRTSTNLGPYFGFNAAYNWLYRSTDINAWELDIGVSGSTAADHLASLGNKVLISQPEVGLVMALAVDEGSR